MSPAYLISYKHVGKPVTKKARQKAFEEPQLKLVSDYMYVHMCAFIHSLIFTHTDTHTDIHIHQHTCITHREISLFTFFPETRPYRICLESLRFPHLIKL